MRSGVAATDSETEYPLPSFDRAFGGPQGNLSEAARNSLLVDIQAVKDVQREALEIVESLLNGVDVGSERSVCRLEREYGLSRFLGHRHEAPVMLQQREAVFVGSDVRRSINRYVENMLAIRAGYSPNPLIVGLDGPVSPHGVLHDNIAKRFHMARGQLQFP